MKQKLTKAEKKEKAKLRWRRRYDAMTPEKKKERITNCNARVKTRRAAKAIEEGRIPGKNGPKPFSPEEKKAADYANTMRWRNKDIEAFRAWDRENKRKIRSTKEGAEKHRLANKKYCERNPEKIVAKGRMDRRTRRARILGVGGKHTAADIAELLRKQKSKCAFCLLALGDDKYHVDHYMPLALGGSNDVSNLRILHRRCNLRKNSKHPVEFAQQNGLLCW